MNRTAQSVLTTATATAAVAALAAGATLVSGGSPAGAAGATCVAYASMPKTLHINARTPTTLRMTLRGSAGCTDASLDNGATAYLDGPGNTHPVYLRWTRFGDTETSEFYATVNATGRYVVQHASVQLYDADSVHVPTRWTTTSVTVSSRG